MNLEVFRKEIDQLDAKIVELLNKRSEAALKVGTLKEEGDAEVYAPGREKEVLEKIAVLNDGPLENIHLQAIYREIMSSSLALEAQPTIAYLGPPATHSHQAALKRFGHSVAYIPKESFEDVFTSVEKGEATYGILPVENSWEGVVTRVQDLLTETALKVCAESYLRIDNCLLTKEKLSTIQIVFSHPQALGQCRKWLRENMPGVECVPVSSTSMAAQRATEKTHAAAIGSRLASEIYKLPLCVENMQDQADNTTRFFILAKKYGSPTGDDKTSLFFGLQHKVGALNALLTVLQKHGLNMLRIESRPSRFQQWEYHFFVDLEGHASDPEFAETLKEMKAHCIFLTVLGSYPKAPAL